MKGTRFVPAAVVAVFVWLAATPCAGSDWARFRGPNGSGVSEVGDLPTRFGPDSNLIWRTELPQGHSSPILSGDRIYLTAFEGEQLLTLCLDRASGEILWRRGARRDRSEKLDARNNAASPSPAVDSDGNVYVFFGDFGLLSYEPSGRLRWRLPLGPFNNLYGMGASPVVVDDLLVLACDQQLDSFLIGVELSSGTIRWRVPRPEAKSGHATPVIYRPAGGAPQILVAGSFLLTAYDAASGAKLWWVGGLPFEMKSTPVLDGDMVFVNGFASPFNQPGRQVAVEPWSEALAHDRDGDGAISEAEFPNERTRGFFSFLDLDADGRLDEGDWNYYAAAMASVNGMLGIRLGGRGDMTATNVVWRYHRAVPQLPSPLLFDGVLTMINDGGIATSFRPATGEVIARGRIKGAVDKYYASPVAADGKIYLVSESGKVAVVRPDGTLEVMAVNDLKSPSYATPALADGRLYVRTVEALWAFGGRE